ncbi:uncharacterized protein LOC124546013 [Schistocerca americana]|uniref:uncharacterized protein LOC124546013 n=1 Tax=Schistocerca americana TaxID=7009 RepID=UPI001F4F35CF|nr:uncharacterized protein LOC124546013 [Schistocerca americana]
MQNSKSESREEPEPTFDWLQLQKDVRATNTQETTREKFARKVSENPLVPIDRNNEKTVDTSSLQPDLSSEKKTHTHTFKQASIPYVCTHLTISNCNDMAVECAYYFFLIVGCLATFCALSYGLWSFRTGQRRMSQYMMRLRIAAQGITIAALIVGLGISATRKSN